jgi:hypothetical protein
MAEHPATCLFDELSPGRPSRPLEDGIGDTEFMVFSSSSDAREGGPPLLGGDPLRARAARWVSR